MSWRKESVRLEVITPVMLGGLTPGQVDRRMPVRPDSVRGALRYWFRAGVAPFLVAERPDAARDPSIDALRRLEAAVFGDTKRASPVVIRGTGVRPPSGAREAVETLNPPRGQQWRGLNYMGLWTWRGRQPPEVLAEGAHLELDLRLRRSQPHEASDGKTEESVLVLEPDLLAQVMGATLWMWVTFGGLGRSVRRGWGSLEVAESTLPHPAGVRWGARPAHRTELLQRLNAESSAVLDTFTAAFKESTKHRWDRGRGHRQVRHLDQIEYFSALHTAHRDPLAALNEAGSLFQDFRSAQRRPQVGLGAPLPDTSELKRSLRQTGYVPQNVDRAAFGLPIQYTFPSLRGRQTKLVPKGQGLDRVASPLIFRVMRHAQGHTVALHNFVGAGDPMQGKAVSQTEAADPIVKPDAAIVKQFEEWARARTRRGRR